MFCKLRLPQSYETKCQVVKEMLVGERLYVLMQITLAAALATSVVLFFRIATKISVFIISLKLFVNFLVDALSWPSRYNRPLNDVKKYFKMIFEVRL